MRTITIFGLKGGTGRTTLTMALASALTSKGWRVLVVDATDRATSDGWYTLAPWAARQREGGLARGSLEALPLAADDDLEEALAGAARRGIDIALVDTGARLNAHHPAAARASDLVLVPFGNHFDATTLSRRIEHAGDTAPIFGVEICPERDELRRRHAAACYGGPILQTALPRSDFFVHMAGEERLDRLIAALDDPKPEHMNSLRFSEIVDMRRAWGEAQNIATEVLWRLKGYWREETKPEWPLADHRGSGSRHPVI